MSFMKEMMTNYEKHYQILRFREWDKHCIKSKKVKELIYHETNYYEASLKLQRKMRESQQAGRGSIVRGFTSDGKFCKRNST